MAKLDQSESSVDDFYFSAFFDEPQSTIFPISDSRYAHELHLQEALVSSSSSISVSISSATISSSFASSSTPPKPLVQFVIPSSGEEFSGESSSSSGKTTTMMCVICAEVKSEDEINNGISLSCESSFCSECIGKHVSAKLQENLHVIPCPSPECRGIHVLEFEHCRQVLPREVIERWDEALCEALVSSAQRFYCPFRDCSAVMIREEEEDDEVIAQSECPACHRLFCARCNVGPWHAGVDCEEFQSLSSDERGREDLLVRELAAQKKWRRCPKCLFYVDKVDGCLHITCRCSFQFCYSCGETWTQTHGGCQTN